MRRREKGEGRVAKSAKRRLAVNEAHKIEAKKGEILAASQLWHPD